MIHDLIRGDVFAAEERAIVFAVNTEGHNDAGFAGLVSSRYWPELASTGPKELGTMLTRDVEYPSGAPLTLAAVVCHSLGDAGWAEAPVHIEAALNQLGLVEFPAAVVLMGAGMIGQMQGADVFANLGAIARAERACRVYTL